MSTSIEICSQVLSYQKRYWWMLSSILAQKNLTDKIVVKCNFHNNDHFDDFSTKILDTFCPLLNLKPKFYDNNDFGVRGYTRIRDIREAECEWILFSDADIIFPENLFSQVFDHIKNTVENNTLYTVGRNTMEPKVAYGLVNLEEYNDKPIINTYAKVKNYANEGRHRRIPGAGYFQLFRKSDAIKKKLDQDESWFHHEGNLLQDKRKFSGDIKFRKRMDVVRIIPTTEEIIHLNHYRIGKKEFNKNACQ